MLSFEELRRAVPLLDARLRGHRIQAASQSDAETLVLSTWGDERDGGGVGHHLVLSCRAGCARVGLAPAAPPKRTPRPAFTQYLRAHLMGAVIGGFRLLGDERELAIRLRSAEGDRELLLAIFGRRSNLALLDAEGGVLMTLRPLADTRPELSLGAPWRSPGSRSPTTGRDRFAEVADENYLEAIEAAYAATVEEDSQGRLRLALARALRKERKALDRKLDKIAQSLGEAEKAIALEREGELLKSVLSRVKRGDTEVVARDFESGAPVVIALDPKLSPKSNLEKMFKRYQKAIRVLTKTGSQHDEVRSARDAAAVLESELETATATEEQLTAFAARPAVARLLARYESRPQQPAARTGGAAAEVKLGKRMVPQRLVPRRYQTAGGCEIWVGRNDAGNDYLTTRLAAGNDLFFHLDGAPGSHVILRTGGRADPPSEAILDACELSVHYSKAKHATRADVHVVPIKNVKKPKGAKPGLVMVHGGKTVHLRRMQTRLERILAASIERDSGTERR